MNADERAFLEQLISAPSPTGYEWPAAAVLRQRLSASADAVETNVMGSVHATLAGRDGRTPVTLLAGHIDEVGLMVTYIDDKGYCYFQPLGSVDAAILPGMRIDVRELERVEQLAFLARLRGKLLRKRVLALLLGFRHRVFERLCGKLDLRVRVALGLLLRYGFANLGVVGKQARGAT